MALDFQGDAANGPTAGTNGQPTRLGRIFLFIGGLGVLFSPITMFIDSHDGDDRPWTAVCERTADRLPEQDLAAIGCPPDPR